jgi:hypothetical protein
VLVRHGHVLPIKADDPLTLAIGSVEVEALPHARAVLSGGSSMRDHDLEVLVDAVTGEVGITASRRT